MTEGSQLAATRLRTKTEQKSWRIYPRGATKQIMHHCCLPRDGVCHRLGSLETHLFHGRSTVRVDNWRTPRSRAIRYYFVCFQGRSTIKSPPKPPSRVQACPPSPPAFTNATGFSNWTGPMFLQQRSRRPVSTLNTFPYIIVSTVGSSHTRRILWPRLISQRR